MNDFNIVSTVMLVSCTLTLPNLGVYIVEVSINGTINLSLRKNNPAFLLRLSVHGALRIAIAHKLTFIFHLINNNYY